MDAQPGRPWPRDLKIFGALCVIWAAGLFARVLVQGDLVGSPNPFQAVLLGYKFYGLQARLVMLLQSFVYASLGIAILGELRWGLVVAMLWMLQVVFSHLAFILMYFHVPGQEIHVRIASAEGPAMVVILLYLWIRGRELIAAPS